MCMNTLTITPKAQAHFRKILQQSGFPAISLSAKRSGCSGYQYVIEPTQEKSVLNPSIDIGDGFVLQVEVASLPLVEGSTIDYVKEAFRERVVISNPNARGACGCGESFNV